MRLRSRVVRFYACEKRRQLENSLSHCVLRSPSERAFNGKGSKHHIECLLPQNYIGVLRGVKWSLIN